MTVTQWISARLFRFEIGKGSAALLSCSFANCWSGAPYRARKAYRQYRVCAACATQVAVGQQIQMT